MTSDTGPLTRPIALRDLPPEGLDVTVEATSEECAALAAEFKMPDIRSLSGEFHLSGSPRQVRVKGRIRAGITQICVVTLDPFDSDIEEDVEVDFAEPGVGASAPDEDPPDEIVNGQIDLGALTAEFLALGLDPYPRKPGVDFSYEASEDDRDTPFAALGKLKSTE